VLASNDNSGVPGAAAGDPAAFAADWARAVARVPEPATLGVLISIATLLTLGRRRRLSRERPLAA